MFKTIAEVRTANQAIGHHWFSRDTVRFFSTRVESGLYSNQCFVTSEQAPHCKRMYTIRRVLPTGAVETVQEYGKYHTAEEARNIARTL